MSTDQRYRERAETAAGDDDGTSRRTWLEIAERVPVWRLERVKSKKEPR